MTNYNIELQYYNGSTYDLLYPKTLGSLIEGDLNTSQIKMGTVKSYNLQNGKIIGFDNLGTFEGTGSTNYITVNIPNNKVLRFLFLCGDMDSLNYFQSICFSSWNFGFVYKSGTFQTVTVTSDSGWGNLGGSYRIRSSALNLVDWLYTAHGLSEFY